MQDGVREAVIGRAGPHGKNREGGSQVCTVSQISKETDKQKITRCLLCKVQLKRKECHESTIMNNPMCVDSIKNKTLLVGLL